VGLNHGLKKPRDCFEKIMTSPSQSRGRFRHFIAVRKDVTYFNVWVNCNHISIVISAIRSDYIAVLFLA
jgi:hypothetical protein